MAQMFIVHLVANISHVVVSRHHVFQITDTLHGKTDGEQVRLDVKVRDGRIASNVFEVDNQVLA